MARVPARSAVAGPGAPTAVERDRHVGREVDTFVRDRVLPELRPVVTLVRRLMREHAPAAKERIAYGIPMWKANGYVAYLSPTKKDITFGFPFGGAFTDRYELLVGRGKWARNVKLRRGAERGAAPR